VSGETVLRAEGLRSGYRGVDVLHGVDLEVRAGEVAALLGPNGAGKTTTLLALAGIIPLTGGTVSWQGSARPGPAHRRARQGLSLLTERSVFTQLSVSANLRMGRGRIGPALELFPELEPLLARRAGLLSGGEQQMLALGRALSGAPVALLIDELSLGLAPIVVTRLIEATKLAAGRGCGVLLVEQQAARALTVSSRAYVMSRGSMAFAGTSAELLADTAIIESSYFASRASGAV
jgi:branched-chain amino acid transport system ATP-binding protein